MYSDDSVLTVIPHYGSDGHLARLLPSLGVPMPPPAVLAGQQMTLPTPWGAIFIANNNGENRGFTAACNEGIRYALGEGFGVVWLLNNDTVVPHLAAVLDLARDEFRRHPRTGVIGCQMRSLGDPDFIHHGGTLAVFPSGVHKTGRVSAGDLTARTEEQWVTGASLLLSTACVAEVGFLDERLFNYASDADYCFRARRAGFDVVYLPVPVIHAVGESAHPSPEQAEVLRRDMTTFATVWMNSYAH